MLKKHLIITLCILAGVLLGITVFSVISARYDTKTIPVRVTVGEYAGFRVDNITIDFGTLPPGSTAEREITITADEESEVMLAVEGIVFVMPRDNLLLVNAGAPQKVTIVAAVPLNQTRGEYQGTLVIRSKKI